MAQLVQTLESRLLPQLNSFVAMLADNYSKATFRIFSRSVEHADYQGHQIGISCILPDVLASEADLIDLSVGIRNCSGNPQITANVVWGHPTGQVEAEFSSSGMALTDEMLEGLVDKMPLLYEAFEKAMQRGRPSQSDDA
jgi:hypothetical protein